MSRKGTEKNPLNVEYGKEISPRHRLFDAMPGAIQKNICQAIIDAVDESCFERAASVQDDNSEEEGVRITEHAWIDNDHWIAGLAAHYGNLANSRYWNFDYLGISEVSLLRYTKTGKFGWHIDALPTECRNFDVAPGESLERKLSLTINLSDPKTYKGGQLQFRNGRGEVITHKEASKQGTPIVFPSTVSHQVTEITEGTRYALVGWFAGYPLV